VRFCRRDDVPAEIAGPPTGDQESHADQKTR
jgi:hypothetical protein